MPSAGSPCLHRVAGGPWLCLGASLLFLAAPDAAWGEEDPGDRDSAASLFAAHTPGSTLRLDHAPWQRFLDEFLHETSEGWALAYGAVPEAAREGLRVYIDTQSESAWESLDRDTQLAAWINLYNALSVEIVLEYWPLWKSSTLRSPPRNERGPYAEARLRVAGVALSADDIRHRILRAGWEDPRLLYALHGAARGGPPLAPQVYRGEMIDAQLEEAARRYVNQRTTVSRSLRGLSVSRLYEWYAGDFGGSDPRVLEHLRHYGDDRVRKILGGRVEIDRYRYDWTLDEYGQRDPRDGLYGS